MTTVFLENKNRPEVIHEGTKEKKKKIIRLFKIFTIRDYKAALFFINLILNIYILCTYVYRYIIATSENGVVIYMYIYVFISKYRERRIVSDVDK